MRHSTRTASWHQQMNYGVPRGGLVWAISFLLAVGAACTSRGANAGDSSGTEHLTLGGLNVGRTRDSAQWNTYRNAKYGYEIQYPEGFEVWPTGPVGERDGRAIRVARKEYAAPTPVLDIHIQVSMATFDSLTSIEAPDMDIMAGDIEIDGAPAREVTYRWKSNGDVVFVSLYFRGALIEFHAPSGVGDVHETVWWQVISTFRVQDN